MVTVKATPTYEELVSLIEAAGSGNAPFFGYAERADGLFLQQDSEEFARLVHYMATRAPAAKVTLDIGIASGGQTKFLRDYYKADQTIVVDIGQHPDHHHWQRIKRDLNSTLVLEIIKDSHDPDVRSMKAYPVDSGSPTSCVFAELNM